MFLFCTVSEIYRHISFWENLSLLGYKRVTRHLDFRKTPYDDSKEIYLVRTLLTINTLCGLLIPQICRDFITGKSYMHKKTVAKSPSDKLE